MTNYVPDTNPFHLAGPPAYWLQSLWEFDRSLVVVPSRQGFYYRLAQRRPLDLQEKMVQDALFEVSDTKMLASHGLVPVTTILATANWSNPFLFDELRRRAPWRMGGAEEVDKKIRDQENKERLDIAAEINDRNTFLSKDAWNYYKMKIGVQSHLYIPKTSQPPNPQLSPSFRIT